MPYSLTYSLKRVPHAYTTPSSPDSARCWVPCIDNLWEKCTWEFEFVVPRYLEERVDNDDDEPSDASPTIVVCSGELVEQVRTIVFLYLINRLILPRLHIHTTQTKPFSCFHKQCSLLCNISLSPQAPFISSQSLQIILQKNLQGRLSHSCMHSVFQVKSTF